MLRNGTKIVIGKRESKKKCLQRYNPYSVAHFLKIMIMLYCLIYVISQNKNVGNFCKIKNIPFNNRLRLKPGVNDTLMKLKVEK